MAKKDDEQKIAVQLQAVETRERELTEELERIQKELTIVRQQRASLQEQLRTLG